MKYLRPILRDCFKSEMGPAAGEKERGRWCPSVTDLCRYAPSGRLASALFPWRIRPKPLLKQSLGLVCLFAVIIGVTGEELTNKIKGDGSPTAAAELKLLQGKWEGIAAGDGASDKIVITISSNFFHFFRDTNFWFDTTIALPPSTHPKQLIATIKGGPKSQDSSMGKVVGAIYKIEDGTLTVATGGGGAEETPKSFDETENKGLTRFELRKVQSPEKNAQPPKTK